MGISEETFDSVIAGSIHTKIGKSNALNTPPVNTPPGAKTPPTAAEKRRLDRSANVDSGSRSDRSKMLDSAIDANALSTALLKGMEDAGRSRDVTPGGSPSRKRQRIYGDR